jgi:hypothetical protein
MIAIGLIGICAGLAIAVYEARRGPRVDFLGVLIGVAVAAAGVVVIWAGTL